MGRGGLYSIKAVRALSKHSDKLLQEIDAQEIEMPDTFGRVMR